MLGVQASHAKGAFMTDEQRREPHDVIIVGGGPAGLSAAVYVARLGLKTAVIAGELGGQALWAKHVENYLGFQLIAGADLVEHFLEHVKRFAIEVIERQFVNAIVPADGVFDIFTREGSQLAGRTVIIASGRAPARLAVPGEKELIGRGVSYCATCDAAFFSGRPVAVAGHGDSAIEAALQLADLEADVLLCADKQLRASSTLLRRLDETARVEVRSARIIGIEGDDRVTGIVMRKHDGSEERAGVEAVFIEAGSIAAGEFTGGLVELNDRGEIQVDREAMTSRPGVFAAGDVTDDFAKQIIVAAGQGARAGMAVARWLRRQE